MTPAAPPMDTPGAADSGQALRVVSTAYGPGCGAGPTTASGAGVREGMVAMGTMSDPVPAFGAVVRILTGSMAGAEFVVTDRIGHGSQLDLFRWDCGAARTYGRQVVEIQLLTP